MNQEAEEKMAYVRLGVGIYARSEGILRFDSIVLPPTIMFDLALLGVMLLRKQQSVE